MKPESSTTAEAVAIVGLAGRFPGAGNPQEFWRNLRRGMEAVSFFSDDQVQWLPIEHAPVPADPRYVKARAVLEKPEWFDAGFFGLNPREAAIMDPQHRVFLECAWEALEDAGCDPDSYPGLIGVFAGASLNTYLFTNLLTNPELVKDFGLFSSLIMNDGDFVPTRVSYKLNLRGPSINVQTACSTSLVAVCLAAQSLLTYRCDTALAGGASITFPPHRGQHHLEGGIMSNDGHCRAFDASASGTVLGDGAGIVVLKRLSEAVAEGDRIYAVIKGTAINNDGAVKIGYTAPSVDGQAECIAMAQAEADVAPESISYVEAHGTGTPLGDPIELAGLTKAFGLKPGSPKTCALGSVKSNIGHLDIAAGVAGLIKTVLALQHEEIPPSLHFKTANPKLELDRTPFVVNAALRPWPRGRDPRRAGVSSFGIGGTNAHVVLEEAPLARASGSSSRNQHLLVVAAKSAAAADAAAANLARHLEAHPEQDLADVAYSLQMRRKAFAHRRAVVARSRPEAIAALAALAGKPEADRSGGTDSAMIASGTAEGTPTIAFLFTGQGAQVVNMGRELYESEPVFRTIVDRCCAILAPLVGFDLRDVIYPGWAGGAPALDSAEAAKRLNETRITQPALFVVEYALAELWAHHGVRPNAMIGHSLGEYVAATLAGVFSLEHALAIVAERARLMQAQPPGAMIAVRLNETRIAPYLNESLSLAATNTRGLCVVSGPFDAITALETKLGESDVASRRLATSHAFHSAMMEPVLAPLTATIRRFECRAPRTPFISNVTGAWITAEQATDPGYWARHVRSTVRFAEGVVRLLEPGARRILIEIGPGQTLVNLARQSALADATFVAVPSLPQAGEGEAGGKWLRALGEVWTAGASVDWRQLSIGEKRRYVSLPTYPFERKRYWIEPGIRFNFGEKAVASTEAMAAGAGQAAGAGVAVGDEPYADRPLRHRHGEGNGSSDSEQRIPEPGANSSVLEQVRGLFAELSGLDLASASPEASFFQLGFDSLFLTQASLAVSRRFHVEVTFRQLREELRSLQKLADFLGQGGPVTDHAVSPATPAETPTTAAPIGATLPLTPTQRELWYASQLGTEVSSAYNESSNIGLRGPLDVPALQEAFRQVVNRHEALRMVILPGGEGQRLDPGVVGALAIRDFTGVPAAEREHRVRAFIDAEVERAFDLAKGPLFRAHLLRVEPERHIVTIVVHHVICDGWSLGILQRDLAESYTKRVGRLLPSSSVGAAAEGPKGPALSFSAYVGRQAEARREGAFSAAAEYWTRQFADGAPTLDLPTDRPRPASRNFAGAFLLHELPADLTDRVKELSARYECTLFTTLYAAFSLLLHRLTGQDDLVIGVPAAAQVMEGLDDLVGHFANLLPIRSRVGDEPKFSDFLVESRRQLFGGLEHWQYPFGELLQQLNLPRDTTRMPLANVVFNSTRLRGTLQFGDLQGAVEGNAKRYSHFDLNLNFAVGAEQISLGAYYSTELFDTATIARWFSHFETLLRGIVAEPDRSIRRLSLLTEAERGRILYRWNDARLEYDREATIAQLFAEQVARSPEAIAMVTGSATWTYRELDARAERLAERLRSAGVGADTLVGIFLERSPELLAAIFGVLKAGGAYVPLDPKYPADRLEFIVADTAMPLVVTQQSLAAQLPAGGFDFLVMDDESSGASRLGRTLAPNREPATAQSLGYVLYTSGSTGRPKGVAMPQRSVAALIAWARDLYRPEELDGVLFSTSVSFDISVFEIFCPLCLGGRIILAENLLDVTAHPAASSVRFLSGVPSAVAELVRLQGVPPSVTTVALAGEQFPQPLVDALYALPHLQRVYELYGPTETTVYSTGSLRTANTHPTLGRPFPNEQVYILDRWLEPVPVGVRGEICIGGDKLARGYLNRPEVTAEKFVPSPFAPGATLYRSGDLGKWCADGTLESLGRADHQVKVRGFRIELGEVEAALNRHPVVAEAAALVRPDSSGHNRLLAYAVPRAGLTVVGPELRRHLQQLLPDYMVPSVVTVLERWPRTASGKADRQALPDPDERPEEHDYVPPGTVTEEVVAAIWCQVLGLSRVGIRDNFFALGGHSLLATQVIARVQEALEVEVTIRQFFATPTVAGLAASIEATMIQAITMAPAEGTLASAEEPA